MEYTSETTLEKILKKEGGEAILHEHGVPCVSCPMAKMEMDKLAIGEICAMYGLDQDAILKDLNS